MRHSVLACACVLIASLASACRDRGPDLVSLPFADDFERTHLGPNWYPSGGHWTVQDGSVVTTGANNAPLFLLARLPADVVVEVDIESLTPIVDSKIELMTDGQTHQSGYVFILGGWKNTLSVIARLDEHGNDRNVLQPTGAKGRTTYRWRIEKKGGDLRWLLDGQVYMTYQDAEPLDGPGHDRLAFSNWQNQIRYDNLRVWPYDQAPAVPKGGSPR